MNCLFLSATAQENYDFSVDHRSYFQAVTVIKGLSTTQLHFEMKYWIRLKQFEEQQQR